MTGQEARDDERDALEAVIFPPATGMSRITLEMADAILAPETTEPRNVLSAGEVIITPKRRAAGPCVGLSGTGSRDDG